MTIAELHAAVREQQIPILQLRCTLGENTHIPGYFGIYQAADGSWLCFENDRSGLQHILFRGGEEKAVSIFYKDLLRRYQQQLPPRPVRPARPAPPPAKPTLLDDRRVQAALLVLLLIALAVAQWGLPFGIGKEKIHTLRRYYEHWPSGYYQVADELYYNDAGLWFGTDRQGGWYLVQPQVSWKDCCIGEDFPFENEQYSYLYYALYIAPGVTYDESWYETYYAEDAPYGDEALLGLADRYNAIVNPPLYVVPQQ